MCYDNIIILAYNRCTIRFYFISDMTIFCCRFYFRHMCILTSNDFRLGRSRSCIGNSLYITDVSTIGINIVCIGFGVNTAGHIGNLLFRTILTKAETIFI